MKAWRVLVTDERGGVAVVYGLTRGIATATAREYADDVAQYDGLNVECMTLPMRTLVAGNSEARYALERDGGIVAHEYN